MSAQFSRVDEVLTSQIDREHHRLCGVVGPGSQSFTSFGLLSRQMRRLFTTELLFRALPLRLSLCRRDHGLGGLTINITWSRYSADQIATPDAQGYGY